MIPEDLAHVLAKALPHAAVSTVSVVLAMVPEPARVRLPSGAAATWPRDKAVRAIIEAGERLWFGVTADGKLACSLPAVFAIELQWGRP